MTTTIKTLGNVIADGIEAYCIAREDYADACKVQDEVMDHQNAINSANAYAKVLEARKALVKGIDSMVETCI